ncbi:unnamed protein product [Acanthoscelides obtectus]|nr:unnamed protein product [Acanthoscelides obtectus]CAK1629336.1 hypothetical protein AOBTE_LOCUS5689 [Acanthoscelides obtectus]
MPSFSPTKSSNRVVTVKTLEEIRLEKIQAESAALYNYSPEEDLLRSRIEQRMQNAERKVSLEPLERQKYKNAFRPEKRLSDDQIASILGDDSLRKKQKIVVENGDGNLKILLGRKFCTSQVSVTITPESRLVKETSDPHDVSDIRIKTLAEIRAERQKKEKEESEVTSTSAGFTPFSEQDPIAKEESVEQKMNLKRKIKLRRPNQREVIEKSNFKRPSGSKKGYDEDALEDELLQDSDSDLDMSINAEDLLLEMDN